MKRSRFPRHPTPPPPDLPVLRSDLPRRRRRKLEQGNFCSLPTSHRSSDSSRTKTNIPQYPRHFTTPTDPQLSCDSSSSHNPRTNSNTAIVIVAKTRTKPPNRDFSPTLPNPPIASIPTNTPILEARLCLGTPTTRPHQSSILSLQVRETDSPSRLRGSRASFHHTASLGQLTR